MKKILFQSSLIIAVALMYLVFGYNDSYSVSQNYMDNSQSSARAAASEDIYSYLSNADYNIVDDMALRAN